MFNTRWNPSLQKYPPASVTSEWSLIIDTPGLREVAVGASDSGLEEMFADIEDLSRRCRFRDCQHGAEPGCAVRAALTSGELEARRFQSHCQLQREIRHGEQRQDHRRQQQEKARQNKILKALRHHPKR